MPCFATCEQHVIHDYVRTFQVIYRDTEYTHALLKTLYNFPESTKVNGTLIKYSNYDNGYVGGYVCPWARARVRWRSAHARVATLP